LLRLTDHQKSKLNKRMFAKASLTSLNNAIPTRANTTRRLPRDTLRSISAQLSSRLRENHALITVNLKIECASSVSRTETTRIERPRKLHAQPLSRS
jgi:hypothetical protein